MDIQYLIAVAVGIVALFYIGFRFNKQLYRIEQDPKCDDCPAIDIDGEKK